MIVCSFVHKEATFFFLLIIIMFCILVSYIMNVFIFLFIYFYTGPILINSSFYNWNGHPV